MIRSVSTLMSLVAVSSAEVVQPRATPDLLARGAPGLREARAQEAAGLTSEDPASFLAMKKFLTTMFVHMTTD